MFGDRLDAEFVEAARRVRELVRNGTRIPRRVMPGHVEQIDHAVQMAVAMSRHRQQDRLHVELRERLEGRLEIRLAAIEAVQKGDDRNLARLGEIHHPRGPGSNARESIHHQHRAVHRLERELALRREVGIAGRVDQCVVMTVPVEGEEVRGDRVGTMAGLFFRLGVQDG